MNNVLKILLIALALNACATRPCAYIAIGEKLCLAPLPARASFAQRSEMVVASSAQGPLTALAQTQWSDKHYASAVTTLFGQRLYLLHFDGQQIQFELGDMPLPLRVENVMLDTQLMWWPLGLLRSHLPSAARLDEHDENGVRVRELWWNGQKRIRIVYQRDNNADVISFEQLGLNYQLLVKELPDD